MRRNSGPMAGLQAACCAVAAETATASVGRRQTYMRQACGRNTAGSRSAELPLSSETRFGSRTCLRNERLARGTPAAVGGRRMHNLAERVPAPSPLSATHVLRTLLLAAAQACASEEVGVGSSGCTDPAATNFVPSASVDSGECSYSCTDLSNRLAVPAARLHCYVHASNTWPHNLTNAPDADNTLQVQGEVAWAVQGRPHTDDPALQPWHVNVSLPYRLAASSGSQLLLRYVALDVDMVNPHGGASCCTYGGAIAVQGETTKVSIWGVVLRKTKTTVKVNHGGGIWVNGGSLHVDRTRFDSIVANAQGGGIFVQNNALLVIADSMFWQNEARGTAPADSGGGAIFAETGVTLMLFQVNFTRCKAPDVDPASGSDVTYFGDAVLCKACTNILVNATNFVPFDRERTMQFDTSWLATVGGCSEHPCSPGSSCRYSNYSLFCDECPDGTFGNDGLMCQPCKPGHGPNADRRQCVPCVGPTYSAVGACENCSWPNIVPECPDGHAPLKDYSGCAPCGADEECNFQNHTLCVSCGAGFQPNSQTHGTKCVPCPAGTVSATSDSVCRNCTQAGEYALKGESCRTCDAGKQPDPTSSRTSCMKCEGNDHSDPTGTGGICKPCPDHQRPKLTNGLQTQCENCPERTSWSDRSQDCACSTRGGTAGRNNGYYDISHAIIVCFHDGYVEADINSTFNSFDRATSGQLNQCQECPDCVDCSTLEGKPMLKNGYTLGEPHVKLNGSVLAGAPGKAKYKGKRVHHVFFCDVDTAVSATDVAEHHYFTTRGANKRCNNSAFDDGGRGNVLLPILKEDLDAVDLAIDEPSTDSLCSKGYNGTFCESCFEVTYSNGSSVRYHKNFGTHGDFNCYLCKSGNSWLQNDVEWWMYGLFAVIVVVVMVVLCQCLDCICIGAFASRRGATALVNDSQPPTGAASRISSCRLWMHRVGLALFPSVRTIITYCQVTSQLSNVLHVQYPPVFSNTISSLHNLVVLDIWSLFSVDCMGLGSFYDTWWLRICIRPLLFLLVCLIPFVYARFCSKSHKKRDYACESLVQNWLRVVFLCYPSVCNMAFSTLHCRPGRNSQVLVDDDRVRCEDDQYNKYMIASCLVVLVVGIGTPFIFLCLVIKATRATSPDVRSFRVRSELQGCFLEKAATQLGSSFKLLQSDKSYLSILDPGDQLADFITAAFTESTALRPFASFTEAYWAYRKGQLQRNCLSCWSNSAWEAVDMLRKLSLVGLVVLLGRGSVFQLLCCILLSIGFFALHVKMWPMKTNMDNLLRASCEFNVFLTIVVAFAMKSDLSHEPAVLGSCPRDPVGSPDHETCARDVYDYFLLGTAAVLVFFASFCTFSVKLYKIWRLQFKILPQLDSPSWCSQLGAVPAGVPAKEFIRYCAAVSSSDDRNQLKEYFDRLQGRAGHDGQLKESLLSRPATPDAHTAPMARIADGHNPVELEEPEPEPESDRMSRR